MVLASARGLLTGVIALPVAGVVGVAILVVGDGHDDWWPTWGHPSGVRLMSAVLMTPVLVAVIGVLTARLLRLPFPRAFANLGWPFFVCTLISYLIVIRDDPMASVESFFLNGFVIAFLLLPYPILACARTAKARAAG
jgi:hypothetical protein